MTTANSDNYKNFKDLQKKMFVCMQQTCQLKSFNKSIRKHRMNNKPTGGESMQYKKKIYDIHMGLLKHGF